MCSLRIICAIFKFDKNIVFGKTPTYLLKKKKDAFVFGCIVWIAFFFLNFEWHLLADPFYISLSLSYGFFLYVVQKFTHSFDQCCNFFLFRHSFLLAIRTRKIISNCGIARIQIRNEYAYEPCIHVHEQHFEGPSKFLTAPDSTTAHHQCRSCFQVLDFNYSRSN